MQDQIKQKQASFAQAHAFDSHDTIAATGVYANRATGTPPAGTLAADPFSLLPPNIRKMLGLAPTLKKGEVAAGYTGLNLGASDLRITPGTPATASPFSGLLMPDKRPT